MGKRPTYDEWRQSFRPIVGADPSDDLTSRIEALATQAEQISDKIKNAPSDSDVKALSDQLEALTPTIEALKAEKDARDKDNQIKSLTSRVEQLGDVVKQLREPGFELSPVGGKSVNTDAEDIYGGESKHSFYEDIRLANKGNPSAYERMAKALGHSDVKAMTEGTDSAGGYLVPTQISDELIRLRFERAQLRQLFSTVNVTSDTFQIPAVTGGLTAGWVAELAEKPASDLTFGQISTSVFTEAGLAVVSNQLLQDARPSIDGLINSELAARLALLEEKAFIDGTGTGQPLGILGTSGINTVTLTATDVLSLLDAILDAINAVETTYFDSPTGILLHPRTWNRIVKARESGTAAQFIVGSGANDNGRRASDGRPPKSLFGLSVYTSSNIPTNKGTGTNESRVIVGAFNEGLILDHTGLTLDQSPHVYFTSNQTVFRAEARVGFTAARYPKAFAVVQGAGLANG